MYNSNYNYGGIFMKLQTNNYITQEVGTLRKEVVETLGVNVSERQVLLYPGPSCFC